MRVRTKGLKQARNWITGIAERKIPQAFDDALTGEKAREAMKSNAKVIVENVVYAYQVKDESARSYRLLNSIGVVRTPTGVGIGLVAEEAPSKWDASINYGRYMLPEFAASSFIQRTAPDSLPRDFLSAWDITFADILPRQLKAAINRRVK